MNQGQLLALIIRNGLPAAMEIANMLRQPEKEVTDDQWQKLKTLASRPFEHYQGPRPGESTIGVESETATGSGPATGPASKNAKKNANKNTSKNRKPGA